MVLNYEENPSKGINDLCIDNTNLLRSGKVGLSDQYLFVNLMDSNRTEKKTSGLQYLPYGPENAAATER